MRTDGRRECQHAVEGGTLTSYDGRQRFLQCEVCRSVFWYDGPSILADNDPMRKRTWSERLIELDDAAIEKVKRT